MNSGVGTLPCQVASVPARAAPSVASIVIPNPGFMPAGYPVSIKLTRRMHRSTLCGHLGVKAMTTADLRKEIKKAIDQLPPDRLLSLADYVHFLERPALAQRLKTAKKEIASGRGTSWRKMRADV
jgi:hypothetical protein